MCPVLDLLFRLPKGGGGGGVGGAQAKNVNSVQHLNLEVKSGFWFWTPTSLSNTKKIDGKLYKNVPLLQKVITFKINSGKIYPFLNRNAVSGNVPKLGRVSFCLVGLKTRTMLDREQAGVWTS